MDAFPLCTLLLAVVLGSAASQPIIDAFLPQQSVRGGYEYHPVQYSQHISGSNAPRQTALYTWFPWTSPSIPHQGSSPMMYDNSGHTNPSTNPFANFFQNPIFPWWNQNRPGGVQSAANPGWNQWNPVNLLPWASNNHQQQLQQQQSSGQRPWFFQNPAGAIFSWNRPTNGVSNVYQTPVAPQVVAPQETPVQQLDAGSPTLQNIGGADSQKPLESVILAEDSAVHQMDHVPGRRVTVHQVPCS